MSYYFTSESVSQGHPDKVADQISDAIVDNFIARDKESHCAIETLVTTGQVIVAGEVKSKVYVDIPEVVRHTINRIGYTKSEYRFDGNSCGVLNAIHEQSENINRGVSRAENIQQGAGDQGIMFGYATNETGNYMPATLDIAHRIVKELAIIREEEPELMPYLRPDAKSQVTIRYSDDNVPEAITDIVVSTQHDEFDEDEAMLARIKADVINILIPRVKEKCDSKTRGLFSEHINYYVNPTGKFVIGGPHGDTGLCLAAGTKVSSPENKYVDSYYEVDIENICVGDTVYTESGVAKVIDIFSNGVKPVIKIVDEYGHTISATANHPFRVRIPGTNEFEWKECGELKVGDVLVRRDSILYEDLDEDGIEDIIYSWAPIVNIYDGGEKKETWDITLDDDTHSFVANGFIVHNTGRKIIVDTYGGWGAHGGGAFCVDGDTEFLSDDLQWHKIKDYNHEKVAQWTEEETIEFVTPQIYHMTESTEPMYRLVNDQVDMVLSPDHDMVFWDNTDVYEERKPYKVPVRDIARVGIIPNSIPAAFDIIPNTIKGSVYVTEEIREYLATGESLYERYHDASWGTLCTLGSVLLNNYRSEHPDDDNFTAIPVFKTPDKIEADFVQVVMTNMEHCVVRVDYDVDKKEYTVWMYSNMDSVMVDWSTDVERYETDKMYCFTVESGYLLLRRNGKMFITGNCGKDVSKVDRSAAYMARYMAKNAVAAGVSDRMLIQLAYAIGVAEPISIFVDTYGTSHVLMSDDEIAAELRALFDLRPYAIEQQLKLREPIYEETASYGHMGQEPRTVRKVFTSNYSDDIVKDVELFTWEKLDMVDKIKGIFFGL